jgi:hypothetical protein
MIWSLSSLEFLDLPHCCGLQFLVIVFSRQVADPAARQVCFVFASEEKMIHFASLNKVNQNTGHYSLDIF